MVQPLDDGRQSWPGDLESDGKHKVDLCHNPGLSVGAPGQVEGGEGQCQPSHVAEGVRAGVRTVQPVVSLRRLPQRVSVTPASINFQILIKCEPKTVRMQCFNAHFFSARIRVLIILGSFSLSKRR